MLKLSLAAVLVYGATAVSTDAKGQASVDPLRNLFDEQTAKDIIELITVPDDEKIEQIKKYWDDQKD